MSDADKPMMSERPEPIGPEPIRLPIGTIVFWVLAAVAVVAMLAATRYFGRGSVEGEGASHAVAGKPLLDIHLEPLTGEPPLIDQQALTGKVTLINYWGTWCPPCRVEFPHLVSLWEELKDEPDFQVAAVSCLPMEETDIDALRDDTARFLEQMKTDLPTYYDPQARSRLGMMMLYGHEDFVFPTTILVDRKGVIRGHWGGYRPGMERDVEALTRQVLAEKH